MRPVLRRMCLYESLINGLLDLADIAEMNDAIDAYDENMQRAQDAARAK